MAAGDISKREIMCRGHAGCAAGPQRPVEESQAEVLASVGSETSASHLLDDATVGAKPSHTPSHHGGKVLQGFLGALTYSNQANILSLPSDCPPERELTGFGRLIQ